MTLNEYQQQAMSTCMESCENFSYMMLNLVGEVGEFASKVAKDIRQANVYSHEYFGITYYGEDAIDDTIRSGNYEHTKGIDGYYDLAIKVHERKEKLKLEAGDILWQLAGLCKVMGWSLEDVAQANLDKLAARKAAGTIVGEGDGIFNR